MKSALLYSSSSCSCIEDFASYDDSESIDLTRSPLPLSRSSSIISFTELSDSSRSSSTSSKIINIGFRPILSDELSSSSQSYSNDNDSRENTSLFPTIIITTVLAAVATTDEDESIGRQIQEEIITDFLAQYVYETEAENITYSAQLGGWKK